MRFETKREPESEGLKKKIDAKVLENNLTSIRELGQKIKAVQRVIFRKRYGNLLGLVEVEVQKFAITALAQYYDPPLRCFTFQDFQLVPTIEEFEQIVDMPLEGKISYQYLE